MMKVQDERLVSIYRRIQSECYQLLVLLLAISILVQQCIFHAPFAQISVECYSLCIVSVYSAVRYAYSGAEMPQLNRKTKFIRIAIGLLVAGLVFFFSSQQTGFGADLVIFLLCFVAITSTVRYMLRRIAHRKQMRMLKTQGDENNLD